MALRAAPEPPEPGCEEDTPRENAGADAPPPAAGAPKENAPGAVDPKPGPTEPKAEVDPKPKPPVGGVVPGVADAVPAGEPKEKDGAAVVLPVVPRASLGAEVPPKEKVGTGVEAPLAVLPRPEVAEEAPKLNPPTPEPLLGGAAAVSLLPE